MKAHANELRAMLMLRRLTFSFLRFSMIPVAAGNALKDDLREVPSTWFDRDIDSAQAAVCEIEFIVRYSTALVAARAIVAVVALYHNLGVIAAYHR